MNNLTLTLFTFLTFAALSCGEGNQTTEPTPDQIQKTNQMTTETPKAPETKSLQAILDERKAQWAAKATDERKKVYNEGIEAVEKSGILAQAKNKGDQAPDFTLKNALDQDVKLSTLLKSGPVILTWYRGGWCPYCNLTLHQLQEELPNFKAEGATLVALTPEVPDKSLSTKEKNELQFEVLSDLNNQVARTYCIVYTRTPEGADIFQKGFDVHAYNGDDSDQLPLAATYIIDQAGTIQYAFLDAEYRNRAEPSEILEELKKL